MDIWRIVAPVLFATSIANAWAAPTFTDEERIDQLLAQMTLEEKVGQLTMVGAGQATHTVPTDTGSVIGIYGAEQTQRLQHQVVGGSRLHIPLLFSFDVIHGFRTIFPVPLAEAAAWDPDLAQRTARAAAVEATASGLHWTFAPMVDIARDPRWGRVVEGSGEDPMLGSALAVARVRGFHGDSATEPSRMITTAKHFVAYGAAEAGRDYNVADISERTLREVYLPPFHAAVQAGTDSIMAGYNEVAGIPMHAHRTLLRELLRQQWGFEGIVISDYEGVSDLIKHGVAALPDQAAQQAFDATVDIEMVSDAYAQALPTLINSQQIPLHAVDDAVRRVLRLKARLGLLDNPYRYSNPAREQALTLTPQTRALAREAAQKSIVLLKNDDHLLPLSKNIHTLVVVGALATDARSTLGPWAGVGRPEESITVLAGLKQAVSADTQLVYVSGASPGSDERSGIDEAERAAREGDAVVVVLGESEDMSGEANSRAFLGFPGAQEALLERLIATGKPLIVILMNGRPLALPPMVEHIPAILETWFLGSEMGHAVADVVFGDVNPSAKLPITFPRTIGQVPIYYAHKKTGRPPDEKEPRASRYIDQPSTPLYPFGHGLSYTTFSYDKPELSTSHLSADEKLVVEVTVHNTGPRSGTEVVQLYLRDDVASVTRPVRSLRGFTRVSLAPGEARTVSFLLDQEDFALLDKYFLRVVEPGVFTVFVGGSSATDNQASFEVTTGKRLPGLGSAIPRMQRETSAM